MDIIDEVLSVKITGRKPETSRFITGWHTFDHAFISDSGEIGFPVRAICEVTGKKGVGKSTFVNSLAARVAAHLGSNIVYMDREEHADWRYLSRATAWNGFSGEIHIVEGGKDGEMLETLREYLEKKNFSVGVLDSVGAILAIAEQESKSPEEAVMGRRAKLMNRWSKQLIHDFSRTDNPKILFATNHLHKTMGTAFVTEETVGGVSLKHLAATRLRLYVKKAYGTKAHLLKGIVVDNAYGLKGTFYLLSMAGLGVHSGLTAAFDCVELKLAKLERGIFKIGDESAGRLADLAKKHESDEAFQPFIEALQQNTVSTPEDGSEAEESDG